MKGELPAQRMLISTREDSMTQSAQISSSCKRVRHGAQPAKLLLKISRERTSTQAVAKKVG